MANSIIAQLLFLDAKIIQKDIYMYINTPGGSVLGRSSHCSTMNFIKSDVQTIVMGMAASMEQLSLKRREGQTLHVAKRQYMIHQPIGYWW